MGTNAVDHRFSFDDGLSLIVPHTPTKTLTAWARAPGSCAWTASAELPVAVRPRFGVPHLAWPGRKTSEPAARVSVQHGDHLLELGVDVRDGGGALSDLGRSLPQPAPPYVGAFSFVASPIFLEPDPECGRRVIGIGVPPSSSSPALDFEALHVSVFAYGADEHRWVDLPDTRRAVALGVARGPVHGTVVGAVSKTQEGGHVFRLLRLTGCSGFELLGELAIDFDWRTPPAPRMGVVEEMLGVAGAREGFVPPFHPPILPARMSTDGARILFAHYDGYDARVLRAEPRDGAWALTFTKTTLHEDRDDLAFPANELEAQ